jgi:hypothetical protein
MTNNKPNRQLEIKIGGITPPYHSRDFEVLLY